MMVTIHVTGIMDTTGITTSMVATIIIILPAAITKMVRRIMARDGHRLIEV